jgi:hypothetical protein
MASELRTQADLAKIRAQELMDTNNSAASDVSDKLLSILEAGESSGIARELLDHYLHDYLKIRVTNSRLANSFEYSRVKFRQLSGIKEKISEIV